MSFSERMGIEPEKSIQVDDMDKALRSRLCNYFSKSIQEKDFDNESTINYILDKLGYKLTYPGSDYEKIEKLILSESWNKVYDLFEYFLESIKSYIELIDEQWKLGRPYIGYSSRTDINKIYSDLNKILSEEKSGYRIANGLFIKISSEIELQEIQNAMSSEFDSVDQHIKKALTLYSDRDNPDYENTIKESISAVEALCCIITNSSGSQATLGSTLKKLEENGVKIHNAMLCAFQKLYGFTSDSGGIRHGSMEFDNVSEEDARYMLISCSAFVNYLKEKYIKIKAEEM